MSGIEMENWKDDLGRDLLEILLKYQEMLIDDGLLIGAAAIEVATAAKKITDQWEISSMWP
jgi:hypothetical protein